VEAAIFADKHLRLRKELRGSLLMVRLFAPLSSRMQRCSATKTSHGRVRDPGQNFSGVSMASAMRAVPQGEYSMPGFSLLIVDDDRWMREACKAVAEKLGFTVAICDSSVSALLHLASRPEEVVLINLRQPVSASLDLLTRIKRLHPEAEVILVAPREKTDPAPIAVGNGAFGCLRKPFHTEELRSLLERVAGHLRARREQNSASEHSRDGRLAAALIGRSSEIEKLLRMISKVGPSKHPVLIIGESGTGKEKVARAIHSIGASSNRDFVVVHCASPDPALIEQQLFLAEKRKIGTLFLDEVTAMPADLQAKLVQALQNRQLRPAEGAVSLPPDVRLIAAACHDLEVAVRQGMFRRDLYLRLNVVSLRVPPLRERTGDIPLIANHILEHLSALTGRSYSLSPEAAKLLMLHHWAGNVAELEGCLQRAAALSVGGVVQTRDLPAYLQPGATASPDSTLPGIIPLAEMERLTILNTLERLNGDKLTTARLLGIGKTTLYRKLREYGIAERWISHPSK
jgi:DNA-binding NtrC family response regulator